nr:pyridoxamine 5'-phosphate oxidase family protein [Sorangium cellulosum]
MEGADVSHRGSKPGFVRVTEEDGRTVLTSPDFTGNFGFNTLGNLALNPRAGVLFVGEGRPTASETSSPTFETCPGLSL